MQICMIEYDFIDIHNLVAAPAAARRLARRQGRGGRTRRGRRAPAYTVGARDICSRLSGDEIRKHVIENLD